MQLLSDVDVSSGRGHALSTRREIGANCEIHSRINHGGSKTDLLLYLSQRGA